MRLLLDAHVFLGYVTADPTCRPPSGRPQPTGAAGSLSEVCRSPSGPGC